MQFNKLFSVALLSFAMMGASHGAFAKNKERLTGSDIKQILMDAGLDAQISREKGSGNPVAKGRAGNIAFYVRGMECSGSPRACEHVMFFTTFNLGREVSEKDLKIVNNFNERNIYGRAFVIPARKQVGVDYMLDVSGGVSDKHISRRIKRWSNVIENFVQQFNKGNS